MSPDSLDPNEPEFPKLIDPPFRSAKEPLVLSPSDSLQGGQASLDEAPADAEQLTVPASAAQYLREYQKDGIRWLYQQYIRELGGVLGDDMGLGKTCMCVNFVAAVLKKTCMPSDRMGCGADDGRCCLIVVPASVIHQWQSEFARWVFAQVCTIKTGSDVDPVMRKVRAKGVVEVVIVGHDRFRMSADELCSYDWHLAIFDEAHKLKNANAKLVEAARKLSTKRRYGLTGTPIQNNFQELFTLLDLLTPGCMGESNVFHDYYTKPFSVGQKHDATPAQRRKGSERQGQLNELVNKWVLRRDKSLIADQLPGKDDNVVFCKLAGMQTRAYERFLALPDVQLLVRSKEPCDCGSNEQRSKCCYRSDPAGVLWPFYHPDGSQCRQCPHCCLFPAMQKLIQISNHLALLRPRPDDKPEKQEFDALLWEELTHGERPQDLEDKYINTSSAAHCGKLRVTKMLLRQFQEEGSKVLLFSFSTKLLDIIETMVEVEGYVFSRLDGTTPQKDRGKLCANFNNDPSLFLMLISTHAGGLGLNLAAADKVIIFDPNWNPSFDLQAQDRAFRIGQQRFVSVYRLITSGTIEEVVYNRQVAKQQMANATLKNSRERRYFQGVMGPNGRWIEEGELGGIRNLFSLTKDEVTTKEIEAREHARAKLNILKIPPDIMDGMKKDAGGASSDKDENRLLKELAQLMEEGERVGGAVGRHDLEAEGAVHVHLNTSTDSSRRQMVGSSALDEFELKHLSPEEYTEPTLAGAGAAPVFSGATMQARAPEHPLANRPRAPAAALGRGGAHAGGDAAAPAQAPAAPLDQAMLLVAERRGLSVAELKSQIASDTIDGGKQVAIAEIQQVEFSLRTASTSSGGTKQAKSKPTRQQSLPESFAAGAARGRTPWSQLTQSEKASAVLDEVARRDGFANQQQLRDFIAECKSEEGIAEYGQDECDRCLTRIAVLSQEIQEEMNANGVAN